MSNIDDTQDDIPVVGLENTQDFEPVKEEILKKKVSTSLKDIPNVQKSEKPKKIVSSSLQNASTTTKKSSPTKTKLSDISASDNLSNSQISSASTFSKTPITNKYHEHQKLVAQREQIAQEQKKIGYKLHKLIFPKQHLDDNLQLGGYVDPQNITNVKTKILPDVKQTVSSTAPTQILTETLPKTEVVPVITEKQAKPVKSQISNKPENKKPAKTEQIQTPAPTQKVTDTPKPSTKTPSTLSKTRFSKKGLIIVASVAALLVIAGGVSFGIHSNFEDKALWGVHVVGIDVGGKTADEVKDTLDDAFKQAQIKVALVSDNPAVDTSTKDTYLSDFGIAPDTEALANEVVYNSKRDVPFFNAYNPFVEENVLAKEDTDENVIRQFISNSYTGAEQPVVSPIVQYNGDLNVFDVVPGQFGMLIDIKGIAQAIDKVLENPHSEQGTLSLNVVESAPKVPESAATELAQKFNDFTANPISFTSDQGVKVRFDRTDMAARVSFASSEETGKIDYNIDLEAVRDFVNSQVVRSYSVDAVPGVEKVGPDGTAIGFFENGHDGVKVTNADSIADALVKNVSEFKSDPITVATTVQPAEHVRAERWVEVHLAEHRTYLMDKGNVVDSFLNYHGSRQYPTPTGIWKVYLKREVQDMRGYNADGSTYFAPAVPWISYYDGGYALHGTPYVNALGKVDQSHGCTNHSPADAKKIFDFAPIGTYVVVTP
jgi:lipoprotein-anchoring transpeptidase ErfK/SrfK